MACGWEITCYSFRSFYVTKIHTHYRDEPHFIGCQYMFCKLLNRGSMTVIITILIKITITHATYVLKIYVGSNYVSAPDLFIVHFK
jgi:hypothetical protein